MMCVDYRASDKITIKNWFLIPRIDEILDKLQGSVYFNRVDLKSGAGLCCTRLFSEPPPLDFMNI